MAKINNTTSYPTATPTNTTMLIGSESVGGGTKNYKVSDLSSFLNLNPTLSTLEVTGNASIGGTLTLGSTSISGSGITTGTILSTGTIAGAFLAADPANAPASAGAAGVTGSIVTDTNYIYVCIATNMWKRVAIATW